MMTRDTATKVAHMIYKELSRWSLMEMCENWDVTPEDLDEFISIVYEVVGDSDATDILSGETC